MTGIHKIHALVSACWPLCYQRRQHIESSSMGGLEWNLSFLCWVYSVIWNMTTLSSAKCPKTFRAAGYSEKVISWSLLTYWSEKREKQGIFLTFTCGVSLQLWSIKMMSCLWKVKQFNRRAVQINWYSSGGVSSGRSGLTLHWKAIGNSVFHFPGKCSPYATGKIIALPPIFL